MKRGLFERLPQLLALTTLSLGVPLGCAEDGPRDSDGVSAGNDGQSTIGMDSDTSAEASAGEAGEAGEASASGGDGDDSASGGDGDDSASGGDGDDSASGGDGDDTASGGDGDDTASGGDGDDTASGGDGDDSASGGDGDDTASGGDGDGDFCGDGVISGAEACDDGAENGTGLTDCTSDCEITVCGDAFAGASEACDEGANNGVETQSDCMSDCTLTVCGDSYVGSSEDCDDGNTVGGDACSATCATPCFDEQFTFQGVPPNIVLVLDKSGSMFYTSNFYDHDLDVSTPEVSRWQALHEAVTGILGDYDTKVNFGVKVFPSDLACGVNAGVDVPCAAMNAANILGFIPAATANLDGTTPSGEAIQQTLNYLNGVTEPGPKAMIFMADGATTCGTPSDPTDISNLVSNAYNGGNDPSIPTYVVGINSTTSSTDAELNAYANAGGFPNTNTNTGTTLSVDDFESGDFSGGNYGNNPQWVVDTQAAASGSFSAHNQNIGDNQTADFTLDVNLGQPGYVKFNYRTDSENNFDYLRVLVDGAEQFSAAGTGSPWAPAAVNVGAGAHTITFRYDKDGSVSSGADQVWVDDVEIVEGGSYSNTAYYDAQSTAALYDALDQITASLITCDLALSVPPLSPDDISVTVDGSSYDQITAADCANDVDGWYYSIQYTQLTLCGNACDAFKALATPAADVEYFCTGGG